MRRFGREGVFYMWSGLYEADAIRRDFHRLLRTVRLR